ncbi:MAG: hypothetical protein WC686_05080 [Candidatus Shapirobacteria bacterium]|jgi:hypothetical protein
MYQEGTLVRPKRLVGSFGEVVVPGCFVRSPQQQSKEPVVCGQYECNDDGCPHHAVLGEDRKVALPLRARGETKES